MNCPNCGAPKRGPVCEYCGTCFARRQREVTVEVEHDFTCLYDWSGEVVMRIANGPNTTVEVVEQ